MSTQESSRRVNGRRSFLGPRVGASSRRDSAIRYAPSDSLSTCARRVSDRKKRRKPIPVRADSNANLPEPVQF